MQTDKLEQLQSTNTEQKRTNSEQKRTNSEQKRTISELQATILKLQADMKQKQDARPGGFVEKLAEEKSVKSLTEDNMELDIRVHQLLLETSRMKQQISRSDRLKQSVDDANDRISQLTAIGEEYVQKFTSVTSGMMNTP